MNVSCPECRSVFRVDPAKVPGSGVRARCSVCGGVIPVPGGALPVAVAPSVIPPAASFAAASPAAPVVSIPVAVPTVAAVPAPPLAPAPVPQYVASMPTPSAVPYTVGTPGSVSVPTPVVPPSTVTAPPVAAPPAVHPPVAMPTPSERRPINPFLQADPDQRARRMARALVSDLVAYHPQKREEGLRDGTLRQLFRDEIRKSYEEYVEQVGKELADRSSYFQDALNEILAGGQRLF